MMFFQLFTVKKNVLLQSKSRKWRALQQIPAHVLFFFIFFFLRKHLIQCEKITWVSTTFFIVWPIEYHGCVKYEESRHTTRVCSIQFLFELSTSPDPIEKQLVLIVRWQKKCVRVYVCVLLTKHVDFYPHIELHSVCHHLQSSLLSFGSQVN